MSACDPVTCSNTSISSSSCSLFEWDAFALLKIRRRNKSRERTTANELWNHPTKFVQRCYNDGEGRRRRRGVDEDA